MTGGAMPKDNQRWSRQKSTAFELMRPVAIYILATQHPVSAIEYNLDGSPRKRFGHNRPCWPVRIGNTSSRKDTISANYKGPFVQVSQQGTIWLPGTTHGVSHGSRLAALAVDWLGRQEEDAGAPKLYAEFHDLVVALNLDEFVEEGERHPIRRLELARSMHEREGFGRRRGSRGGAIRPAGSA